MKWTRDHIEALQAKGLTVVEGKAVKKPVDWLKYLEQQKQAGFIHGYTATSPAKEKRKNKYGAVRTEVDGIMFDSVKEAEWYVKLRYLERAGEIQDLRLQVDFELNEGGTFSLVYRADFTYTICETGEFVVVDVKGYRTTEYKKKRRLMLSQFGIKIKEL